MFFYEGFLFFWCGFHRPVPKIFTFETDTYTRLLLLATSKPYILTVVADLAPIYSLGYRL